MKITTKTNANRSMCKYGVLPLFCMHFSQLLQIWIAYNLDSERFTTSGFCDKRRIYAAFQWYQQVIFIKFAATAVSLCTAEYKCHNIMYYFFVFFFERFQHVELNPGNTPDKALPRYLCDMCARALSNAYPHVKSLF